VIIEDESHDMTDPSLHGALPASNAPDGRARGRSRRQRIAALASVVIVGLVVAVVAGFLWWAQPQPLLPEANAALVSTPGVQVEQAGDGRLTFRPRGERIPVGLVIYPGGKVPPAAYAPAARAIAESGYLVAIVPVPFNLAVLDIGAAAPVIADHPEVASWAVGGHSLGGAMAAQFAEANPDLVDGLVLWAAYSAADLSDAGLPVASVYGTLDGGLEAFTDAENTARLGSAVMQTALEGGNHEQMGWYTGQPNDPPAAIGRHAQQDAVVAATLELLAALE
jgi:pimeloyl-ACP methyl ester carboxylesterase